MTLLRLFSFLSAITLLNACSTTSEDPNGLSPTKITNVYCDSYLSYDMCSEDLNGNGEVDILFFADTNEIIMYWEESEDLISGEKPPHRCMQLMSEAMRKSCTKTLYVHEDTDIFTRTKVRTGIFLSFTRYWPGVNSCMGADENEDEFGSEFPDEF